MVVVWIIKITSFQISLKDKMLLLFIPGERQKTTLKSPVSLKDTFKVLFKPQKNMYNGAVTKIQQFLMYLL